MWTRRQLKDARFFFHNGTFTSVKDVVRYFDAGVPQDQQAAAAGTLTPPFTNHGVRALRSASVCLNPEFTWSRAGGGEAQIRIDMLLARSWNEDESPVHDRLRLVACGLIPHAIWDKSSPAVHRDRRPPPDGRPGGGADRLG